VGRGGRLDRLHRLGGLGGLFGLDFATQAVSVGAPTDAVRLGVFDRGRRARGTDAQFLGERQQLFARHTELF
jgi:hypothetical protein